MVSRLIRCSCHLHAVGLRPTAVSFGNSELVGVVHARRCMRIETAGEVTLRLCDCSHRVVDSSAKAKDVFSPSLSRGRSSLTRADSISTPIYSLSPITRRRRLAPPSVSLCWASRGVPSTAQDQSKICLHGCLFTNRRRLSHQAIGGLPPPDRRPPTRQPSQPGRPKRARSAGVSSAPPHRPASRAAPPGAARSRTEPRGAERSRAEPFL